MLPVSHMSRMSRRCRVAGHQRLRCCCHHSGSLLLSKPPRFHGSTNSGGGQRWRWSDGGCDMVWHAVTGKRWFAAVPKPEVLWSNPHRFPWRPMLGGSWFALWLRVIRVIKENWWRHGKVAETGKHGKIQPTESFKKHACKNFDFQRIETLQTLCFRGHHQPKPQETSCGFLELDKLV